MLEQLKRQRALRGSLADIAAILDGTDQRYWASVLRALRDRVDADPGQTARNVLALYEGPRAPRGATEGAWALDTIGVTRDGDAYTADNPVLWEQTLRYTRLLHDVYQNALGLWQVFDVARLALPIPSQHWVKLADYGGGSQVWGRSGQYVVRYDCGAHVSVFREDAIGKDEAEQAMLGPTHFTRMILALQARLQSAGVNPYMGSYDPLPDPI